MKSSFDLGPRAQAAVLLALVALLGVLVGIGVDRLLLDAAPAGVEAPPPRHGPGGAVGAWAHPGERRMNMPPGARFSDQLAEELELSAAQKAQIDSILAEGRTRVRGLMREYRPRFREIARDTRSRVDAVLTERQRERLRELRGRRLRERVDSAPAFRREGRGPAPARSLRQ